MIYDPVTGIIMGVMYGVPAYLGACVIRYFFMKAVGWR